MPERLAWYTARYGGTEYSCAIEPSIPFVDVRLHHDREADGFTEVEPGRFVKVVPMRECDAVVYRYLTCRWRSLECIILDEDKSRVLVEYAGGDGPAAQAAGLDCIERGVYRAWVPADEVRERRPTTELLKSPAD